MDIDILPLKKEENEIKVIQNQIIFLRKNELVSLVLSCNKEKKCPLKK